MAITAKDVAALRQRTGAGMMDCKKALEETDGDMDKAVELLRTKGTPRPRSAPAARSKEGMIANYIHHNGKVAVLVELNCETDFVARTDDFQQLGKWIAEHIAAAAPVAVDKDQVPQEKVESERRIFVEQVKARGQARAHDREDRRGQDRRRSTRTSRCCTRRGSASRRRRSATW